MTVPVVYIAGPFRAPTTWGIAENVRRAERVGLMVARSGGMPLIPHANTHLFHGEGDDALWLEGTMELMRRCDGIVLVEGWASSKGTAAELDEARRLGIPVYSPQATDEALSAFIKGLKQRHPSRRGRGAAVTHRISFNEAMELLQKRDSERRARVVVIQHIEYSSKGEVYRAEIVFTLEVDGALVRTPRGRAKRFNRRNDAERFGMRQTHIIDDAKRTLQQETP